MKDDIGPPFLGQTPKLYDYGFVDKAMRLIEQTFRKLLSTGPIRVSEISNPDPDPTTGTVLLTGNYTVTGSFNISAATAGQVVFPAVQHASSNVNTLDDYEEGPWTPALATTGTAFTSVTYTTQTGSYTKIGNMVHVTGVVITSAVTIGAATGQVTITGLPFASAAFGPAGSVGFSSGWASAHPRGILASSTTLALYGTPTATGTYTTIVVADVATGALGNQVYFGCTYFV